MTKTLKPLIFLILLAPTISFAQGRQSLPFPTAEDTTLNRLNGEDITGWTYGEDQRWYSIDHAIPVRTTTLNWEKIKEDPSRSLGEDNFEFMDVFRIYFGTKPYIIIAKATIDGHYKYPGRKRGWELEPKLYFFMLEESELKKIKTQDSIGTFLYTLNLVDHGYVQGVKLKKRNDWVEEICKKAVPRERYPWALMFHVHLFGEQDIARFQLYAMHKAFKDIDGVRNVQEIRGTRIYGKEELMDYFYYEIPFSKMFQYLRTMENS